MLAALRRQSGRSVLPVTVVETALEFLTNQAAGSDIRLEWEGDAYMGRTNCTSIWKANYTQQNSYYTTNVHSGDDNAFRGAGDLLTSPWPGNSGAFDVNGDGTDGNASSADHWYEVAAHRAGTDHIATGSLGSFDTAIEVTTGVWQTAACIIERIIGGTVDRVRYYPDISSDTYIEDVLAVVGYPVGVTYKMTKFASPWRANSNGAGTNDEVHCGLARGFQDHATALSIADIRTLAALTTDAAVVAHALSTSLWYCNLNPTHTDVTDKSGNGHHPAWANANRPTTVTL